MPSSTVAEIGSSPKRFCYATNAWGSKPLIVKTILLCSFFAVVFKVIQFSTMKLNVFEAEVLMEIG